MLTGLTNVTIWTENAQNLLPFYRDVLGLTIYQKSPEFIVFSASPSGPFFALGTHSEIKGRALDPYRVMVGLASTDLDADYQRLSAAGVEFIEPPTLSDSLWIATLRDPEGNLIQLFQPAS